MRKITLLTIVFLFLATLSVCAQRQGQRATPKEQAVRMVERMDKELKLTDKQKADLKTWYEASFQKRSEAAKKGQGDKEAMRKAMKENRENADAQLKKILTADQYKKHKENEEKRRQEVKGKRPAF